MSISCSIAADVSPTIAGVDGTEINQQHTLHSASHRGRWRSRANSAGIFNRSRSSRSVMSDESVSVVFIRGAQPRVLRRILAQRSSARKNSFAAQVVLVADMFRERIEENACDNFVVADNRVEDRSSILVRTYRWPHLASRHRQNLEANLI